MLKFVLFTAILQCILAQQYQQKVAPGVPPQNYQVSKYIVSNDLCYLNFIQWVIFIVTFVRLYVNVSFGLGMYCLIMDI